MNRGSYKYRLLLVKILQVFKGATGQKGKRYFKGPKKTVVFPGGIVM